MTLGSRRAVMIVAGAIAALLALTMATMPQSAQSASGARCALSARDQLPAGTPAYALALSAQNTPCAVAIRVMRAFHRCRGDQHLQCTRKLGSWRCTGHKTPGAPLGLPEIVYGSFTCRSPGARRVVGRYQENSPRCFGAASRDPLRPCSNPTLSMTPDLDEIEPHALDYGAAGCDQNAVPGACVFGVTNKEAHRRIALVGDSHTFHWRAALALVAQVERWRGYSISTGGCWFSTAATTFFPPCEGFNNDVLAFLRRHPEVDTVFVTSNADTPVAVPAGQTYASFKIDGFRRAWQALPKSVEHVVVLRDTPASSQATFECMSRAEAAGKRPGTSCPLARAVALRDDEGVAAVKALHAKRYQYIDLTDYFCGRRDCYPVIAGARVNADVFGHLTPTYMRSLGPYLKRAIDRLQAGW